MCPPAPALTPALRARVRAWPRGRRKRLAQLHQQTACFSLLWKIYSLNYFFHYKYYAQLAALMQVNTALETQDAFQVPSFRSISSGGRSPGKANWTRDRSLTASATPAGEAGKPLGRAPPVCREGPGSLYRYITGGFLQVRSCPLGITSHPVTGNGRVGRGVAGADTPRGGPSPPRAPPGKAGSLRAEGQV